MSLVGQLLQTKGHEVYTVGPETTVYEAIRVMADKCVGALIVEDSSSVVGIISERDYTRRVVLLGRSSRDTFVRVIMSSPVISAGTATTIRECMEIMSEHRIRHLPIIDNNQLAGIVSLGDLVKTRLSQQENTISMLKQYIRG